MDIQISQKAWKWQVVYYFFLCNWGWVIGQLRYSIIEESNPGTVVGNVAQDLGLNLAAISKRRLHFGSEGSRRRFAVDQESGDLTVKEKIDRESLCGSSTSCLLHIEVVAENPLELFSIEIEIVDINDNSPSFSNVDHNITITEVFTSPGARFSLETAEDEDVGVHGISQYQLNPNPYFSLSLKNRKDGVLIPELVLEKALDREEKGEHKLIITAFDGGEPRRSGSCHINIIVLDINDNAPVFEQQSYKINLLENISLNTAILALNATDLDEGPNGKIEYFFDHHTSATVKKLFDLNPQTGVIYIKGILDYEESNFYELLIKAKDKGIPSLIGDCRVQIDVEDANDNPPEIIFTSMITEVPENAHIGTAVGFLSVRDKDSGKNGEVNLEVYPKLPFEFKPFKNHYSLVTSGLLDREKNSQYSIQLIATDLGSPPLKTQTTIILNVSDINDNSPIFHQIHYNAFIKENNEPGFLLCKVSASDSDEGVNSELTYSIVEHQIDDSSVSSFAYINPNSGNIYAQRTYDYEHIQMFQIIVRVEDSGFPKLYSNVTVTVFVLDTNDNYPTILYPEHSRELPAYEKVPKSSSIGYLVTKVSAVDFDSGHNAWLQFSLQEHSSSSLFHVTENTGEIRTIRALQETDYTEHQLIISVSDHGDPPLSTTVSIFVNLVDSIIQESHHSHNFLTNSKPTSDLTLYLIISLVAISLVSLVTFIILIVKCLRKESLNKGNGCFPNGPFSKHNAEQYQPTLYLNTDGTLKYMEVRMVPPEPQGQCYQPCFPAAAAAADKNSDSSFIKPLNFPQLKDMVNEMDPSAGTFCLNEADQVNTVVVKQFSF